MKAIGMIVTVTMKRKRPGLKLPVTFHAGPIHLADLLEAGPRPPAVTRFTRNCGTVQGCHGSHSLVRPHRSGSRR
jgi:hypothetical protein